ncbi:MAG: hypothetical protein J6Q84_02240 [Kiritimatiellae bacterium]|nr:hypothetical protein [Kiritimatiellia bacterium]
MKKCNLRSGSALLIVLGMLTFLIVSAVGFSAYMRQGRLPSSQLRRSVAARHLVKAAMAEAIDTIDQAINDNPHPGVGERAVDGYNRNVWCNRIFIGTNDWNESSFDFANTVSPLCLEALAYIPPTLINEARYYSRLSPAAEWKSFDYGVGRYAFCAIDVSDYFDVNRLFANKRRSSAPHERISLAYLFDEGGADKWDTFIESATGRTVTEEGGEKELDIKEPLISIADLNLALNAKGGVGDIKSAFCEGLNSKGEFCKTGETGNDAADNALANMTFVTDSLFPKTGNGLADSDSDQPMNGSDENSNRGLYDLADPDCQPFKLEDLILETQKPETLELAFFGKTIKDGKAKVAWDVLGMIGNVCLWDYLDVDRKPLSLAMPTVERFPMICGIQPVFQNITLAIKREPEPADDETLDSYSGVEPNTVTDKQRVVKKTIRYKIDSSKFQEGLRAAMVRAVTVFPFARKDQNDGNFSIDGKLSFFFSSKEMSLRTGEDVFAAEDDVLHLEKEIKDTELDNKNGILNIKFESNSKITLNASVKEETDVVAETDLKLVADSVGQFLADPENALLRVDFMWTQTASKSDNGPTVWKPTLSEVIKEGDPKKITLVSTAFPAFDATGKKDVGFASSEELKKTIFKNDTKLRLNCAVWLRVKDEDGYVVDMVPACLADDEIQNNYKKGNFAAYYDSTVRIDPAYPLLRFNTGIEFDFSLASLEGNNETQSEDSKTVGEVNLNPKAIIVADPRYNYAPEDWFSVNESLTKQVWLNNNKTGDDRDNDIFMETSDAGYLQSIYELAFLPRTKILMNNGDKTPREMSEEASTVNNKYKDIVNSFSETRNQKVAWRTYNPFSGESYSELDRSYNDKKVFNDCLAFDLKGLPFINEGNGFKVNPFSDSKNVLTAVFANTPLGWRYASTNEVGNVKYDNEADKFNSIYAFSEINQNKSAKVGREDWGKIAQKFIDEIRRENKGTQTNSWENVFLENMDWDNDAENNFLGIDMSESDVKFWGVDKKFLYGFWKDCFAVKQQLFLVFVRAEPTMMGSGATGHAPPQLGGKAVALVWRDPNPLTDTSGDSGSGTDRAIPHRTRVLFYRQFE